MKGNFLLFYCIIYLVNIRKTEGGRLSEEAQYGSNEGNIIKHQ